MTSQNSAFITITAVMLLCQSSTTLAFNVTPLTSTGKLHTVSHSSYGHISLRQQQKTNFLQMTSEEDEEQDSEIGRLRSMAAKLRADAASLEAEKAQKLAEVAERAFREFDTNQDGEISVAELKAGLEKALKTDLSDQRVSDLMKEFDASGDGALQLDEFVGVDRFRNQLEALSREEKRLASEAKANAIKEEEKARLAAAKMDILNEKEPTNQEKALSILPYLFPLMDGLQYGRFLLGAEGAEANPFVIALAVLYALYRAIPLSGFIAFFVLNFLGGNPGINRLIRYNMQQAIFLDIALFFPGLLSALFGVILGGAGVQLPALVTQFSSDAIFASLLVVLGYCTVSSLFGIAPNKIPIVSQAVEDRMPTVDMFDLDSAGNIVPKQQDEEEEDKKD